MSISGIAADAIPPHVERFSLTYDAPIRADVSTARHNRGAVIGKQRMQGVVVVTIDVNAIVREMGRKALESVSGRCKRGHVVVKRTGKPIPLGGPVREGE